MPEKYRPSNGTEGDIFYGRWCRHCTKGNGPDDPCMILVHTMAYDVRHPEYPSEWIVDENGPRCTAFERPGDPKQPRCPDTPDMFSTTMPATPAEEIAR